ncbi:protein SODIUM POTASSIUM ROOT DEFECTIVE 1-like isoform X2 [Macadamia integrifolia]|uniref:protein SODIUM POTASSIUM ROOT DEFECTIVE 1-like isoform X2 n=1 Tax=Macadamia integrifolia TaxID=60698 RepID=UPI001C4F9050|nr:protein SODIUM POTASSIUM ROOT DEFECTIVE 1-like isoform X2 [Macadamia integrifolia]
MKGIDLFCASPASTAICVSFDKSSVVLQGGRAIDRHNPHLRDSRRSRRGLHNTPSSSYPSHSHSHSQPQPPTKSKPYPQNRNQKKTTRKSSAKATDLISPPGSSRYLLSDTSFFDVYSDFDDPISSLVPAKPSRSLSLNPDDSSALKPSSSSSLISSSSLALKASSLSTLSQPSPALKPSSSSRYCDQVGLPSSSSSTRSHDQVVVLRVSLHCKGCEGKVRKHISRMEGVTSFSIDFATKKVTVIGNVTPLGVLASVSRVKNAQIWPSPSSPSPVASSY